MSEELKRPVGRPPKSEEPLTQNEDIIAMKAALLEQQEQIKSLQDLLQNKPERSAKKVDEHFSHVLFWLDAETDTEYAVTKIGKIFEKKVEDGSRRLFGNFELWDGKKSETRKLDYLNALSEGHRYKVKILSVKTDTVTKNQGNSPDPVIHRVQCSDPVSIKKSNGQFSEYDIELTEDQVETVTTIEFMEGPFAGRQMVINVSAGADSCLNY